MKKTVLSFIAMIGISLGINAQANNYPNGSSVTSFTVTDVHGETHDLSAIAASGKWILLDFFFTTCGPCQATVPYFSELHQKYGCNDGDLFCLSIDMGDTDSEVIGFENTFSTSTGFNAAPAASGIEGQGDAVVTNFGVNAFPTYCLIGPDMIMKNRDIWPISSVAQFEAAFTAVGFSPAVQNCLSSVAENTELLSDISVYPNPAVNEATISMNLQEASKIDVQIVNLVGAEVSNQTFAGQQGENNLTLDVSALQSGQYLVKIMLENGTSKQSALNVTK